MAEALAMRYRFAPTEIDALDLEDFQRWYEMSRQRGKLEEEMITAQNAAAGQ